MPLSPIYILDLLPIMDGYLLRLFTKASFDCRAKSLIEHGVWHVYRENRHPILRIIGLSSISALDCGLIYDRRPCFYDECLIFGASGLIRG